MESITFPQLKKLHWLLNELGLMEDKKDLLLHFTNGKKEKASELTKVEAIDLIRQLSKLDPSDKHRRAIWHLAFLAGIVYGDTEADKKINIAKLNKFLREKSVAKKELYQMNLEELKKVHRQFEGIVSNNKKNAASKYAKQLTEQLLNELSITVKN